MLRTEQPKVFEQQRDQMRLQGEFRVRLRALEQSLLDTLNATKGNLLDNDVVIQSLETLKKEAADVTQRMADSERVLAEVERVSSQYRPLALASARIYFSLEQLSTVHLLYQFSLRFFLDVFQKVRRARFLCVAFVWAQSCAFRSGGTNGQSAPGRPD